jgi:hypothetical protein
VTPFEHLAVLVSIIVGLGITQLLSGVHRLAQARGRVRLYWLPLVWVALLFVSQVEWWWGVFAMRSTTAWNFFYFLFVLCSPVALFMASAFVLPEIAPHGEYDLREHYYSSRVWFFAVLALNPLLDAVRHSAQTGSVTHISVWSNLVAAVLLGTLAASRSAAYHGLATLVVAGLFGSFIVSSALQLR